MNQAILAELRLQHEQLRVLIEHCERLADDLDAGLVEPAPVLAIVAELRTKLAEHNRFEEGVLPPLAQDELLVDDHANEHRSMYASLDNPITRELRTTLDRLRRHMAIEERHFQ